MAHEKREYQRSKSKVPGEERMGVYLLNRRKPLDLKALVCLVTFVLAAALVITPVQSQTGQLIPDWTSVTQDFFDIVPGAANPVLTAADVTDRTANYVADPFMFHEGNTWYMFFEVGTDAGTEIGLATSNNGFDWTYQRVVLSEPFDLAYPYVFKWEGTYYLIPETYGMDQVRLYKATNFPYSWTLVSVLISDGEFIPVDSSIFRYNNMWWMFTGDDSNLYLFYSDNLTNPVAWHEHPMSPIVANDPSKVRGGGRVIVFNSNRIIRLTQKGDVSYGEAVRAFQVDTLTTTSYAEHEVPGSPIVAASGSGWNSDGMHNVDAWWTGNSWLAVVDGIGPNWWSIGIYVTPLHATISPTQVRINLGQSQTFSSSVSGGTPPYTYRWYLNGTAQSGATNPTWTFTPTQTGHYNVYLNVTDSLNNKAQSNTVNDIIVYNQLTAAISPTHATLYYGQSQTFSASVTGGTPPYSYQWVLNGTAVPGATATTWMLTPRTNGNYNVYLNVTDSQNNKAQSNTITDINVYSVNLLLTTGNQATYTKRQSVTFTVKVFNQLSPALKSTSTLTVTGPNGYYFYDFQPISVAANGVSEFSFDWIAPNVAGTYVVETSLAPSLLTAYDIVWLKVN